MCWGCLVDDYDLSEDDIKAIAARPAVQAVAALITEFFQLPDCDTGGPIHVVIEDSNVEDPHLKMFEPYRFPADVLAKAQAILDALRELEVPERAVATVIAEH